MDAETAKALKSLSEKINAVDRKIDKYFGNRCDQNAEEISVADGGIVEMADIISAHDEAITELATLVSGLSTATAAN